MSLTRRMQVVLKLCEVPQLGPSATRKLFSRLEAEETELEYLLEFEDGDLGELGLSDEQLEAFRASEFLEIAEQLVESGVELITAMDSRAPAKMRCPRLSPWYFVRGNMSCLHSASVGFSGSRDASPEALELTAQIASSVVRDGRVVISGGARGVDAVAHKAASDAGGHTVVVLPQGIATWSLPEELDLERTLILSEFPPTDKWGTFRAMQRNKSIVHLSDVLVIPQASERGGTWNAGAYALKQNETVFVAETFPEFEGNRKLIELGAIPLDWQGDISAIDRSVSPDDDQGTHNAV